MPSYQVKQSSTAYPLVFLMIDSSDHISPKTGLSPTVTISKAGGSFATPAGAVSEIGSGWYKVAGNATDTATLGPLLLHATASGADPVDALYEVVAVDPQSTAFGLTNLDAAISTRLATSGYTAPLDASGTRTALGMASANLDTQLGTLATASALSSVASSVSTIGTVVTSTGVVVASGSKTGYTLASTGLDAVIVETGLTAKQALQYMSAACFGVISGAGTGTVVIKAGANSGTTRITAATDSSGNRTSVTLA